MEDARFGVWSERNGREEVAAYGREGHVERDEREGGSIDLEYREQRDEWEGGGRTVG